MRLARRRTSKISFPHIQPHRAMIIHLNAIPLPLIRDIASRYCHAAVVHSFAASCCVPRPDNCVRGLNRLRCGLWATHVTCRPFRSFVRLTSNRRAFSTKLNGRSRASTLGATLTASQLTPVHRQTLVPVARQHCALAGASSNSRRAGTVSCICG